MKTIQQNPRAQSGSMVWLVQVVALVVFVGGAASYAQVSAAIDVDLSKPGVAIPQQFFGLMTEEINHSYDGGLYAELIQNRSFQDPPGERRGDGGNRHKDQMPIHWFVVGSARASTVETDPVNPALPISLRLELRGEGGGIANDGFWGIPVRPDTAYTASFYAKGADGFEGSVTASIQLDDGNAVVATADTAPITTVWKKYILNLKTGRDAPTTAKARFVLAARGKGAVVFSYVSLFPPTYQNSTNGLRPDIMKLLADLQPKFIRLPGGNYVEGGHFSDRFNWKQMIGPPDQRPGHMGCWGYRSSDGFGLPEFLLWCKQLGAEPVLALFAGYTLNGDYMKAGSPEMAIYTQEALEEIEYVAGPASSEWGSKRAADGFPEPFPLRYVEVGNEDGFDRSGSYDGRFTQMAKAIRERYPHLKIIATAPVKSFKPDLYDEHYYLKPQALRRMFDHYDKPTGSPRPLRQTKTFVGEWASHQGSPTTNLNAALADAAFVMGLERNSDVVEMQCYAPLFANVNVADAAKGYPRGWQWEHNLIGYDALGSYGSPSYHAQAMLARNKGDVVVDTKLEVSESKDPRKEEAPRGAIGLGAWQTQVEYADISVTAPDGRTLFAPDLTRDLKGWDCVGGDWRVQDKAMKPAGQEPETWAFAGDASWTEYTIRVRARKLAGREGFIVIWHAVDRESYHWWNVGGWDNSGTRAEAAVDGAREAYGPRAAFTVDTGRWYDLRLEVAGKRMRGFIDGKLVTDVTDEPQPRYAVYATATYVNADRTVIVKIVNAGGSPIDTIINLRGVGRIETGGTAIVLTGDPRGVNSVSEPGKVSPKNETISNVSSSFRRAVPAYSLTILRLKASPLSAAQTGSDRPGR